MLSYLFIIFLKNAFKLCINSRMTSKTHSKIRQFWENSTWQDLGFFSGMVRFIQRRNLHILGLGQTPDGWCSLTRAKEEARRRVAVPHVVGMWTSIESPLLIMHLTLHFFVHGFVNLSLSHSVSPESMLPIPRKPRSYSSLAMAGGVEKWESSCIFCKLPNCPRLTSSSPASSFIVMVPPLPLSSIQRTNQLPSHC